MPRKFSLPNGNVDGEQKGGHPMKPTTLEVNGNKEILSETMPVTEAELNAVIEKAKAAKKALKLQPKNLHAYLREYIPTQGKNAGKAIKMIAFLENAEAKTWAGTLQFSVEKAKFFLAHVDEIKAIVNSK